MLKIPLQSVSNGDYGFIKDKIEKFERFNLLFVLPVVVFLAIYSDSIVIFVLGDQYIPSIDVLSIITVGTFIMVLNMPYGNVLTGMGFFNLTAKIHIANVVILIFGLLIFIHPDLFCLNATGAALGIVVSNLFLGITFRLYAKRKLPILQITKNLKFILFGIINFSIFFLLYHYAKDYWGAPLRIAFPIIYFMTTYLAFILLKWININDWKMLFSVLDFKSMKNYVGGEIR